MKRLILCLLLCTPVYAYPCNLVTFPACLGDSPFDATGCSAQYSELMFVPRVDGELALHLHIGISRQCRNQAFDRWQCFLFKCYGQKGLTCPAISSACWKQIN
jgi:hypothetical protein